MILTAVILVLIILMILFFTKNNTGRAILAKVEKKKGLEEVVTNVDNDTVENIVIATNKYILETQKECSYIIETLNIKKIVDNDTGKSFYRCMFMAVRQGGFAYGFAVTVDATIETPTTILKFSTQPMDIEAPSNIKPFVDTGSGEDFVSVFESLKNKF